MNQSKLYALMQEIHQAIPHSHNIYYLHTMHIEINILHRNCSLLIGHAIGHKLTKTFLRFLFRCEILKDTFKT